MLARSNWERLSSKKENLMISTVENQLITGKVIQSQRKNY